MYDLFNFIYSLICYIGIALSIISVIFTQKNYRCPSHIIPHNIVGLSWLLCLYIPHDYGLCIGIFNIFLITHLSIYEIYSKAIKDFDYRRI